MAGRCVAGLRFKKTPILGYSDTRCGWGGFSSADLRFNPNFVWIQTEATLVTAAEFHSRGNLSDWANGCQECLGALTMRSLKMQDCFDALVLTLREYLVGSNGIVKAKAVCDTPRQITSGKFCLVRQP